METDQYKTLKKPSKQVLFKDRNSKFYGQAFPVQKEKEVKLILEELKNQHPTANHHCYAFKLGIEERNLIYRSNDDGEPNNSAGKPILGQIEGFGLTNVIVVVVRYFGGTKLGVGGLIQAYKNTAQLTLEQSEIVTRTIMVQLKLRFDYDLMNDIMKLIREENLNIISNDSGLKCNLIISFRQSQYNHIKELLEKFQNLEQSIL
ncbi:MAG: YigZ family protein [Flavobacteriaceae bacterium]|nr:YigZ family protein [Flavobacteriaceae bacterium]